MYTAKLKTVLGEISGLLGAEPVDAGGPEHVSMIASLNRHLERGWQHDFWPEWTILERRAFRDAWLPNTKYGAPDVALPLVPAAMTDDDGQAITDDTGQAMTDGGVAVSPSGQGSGDEEAITDETGQAITDAGPDGLDSPPVSDATEVFFAGDGKYYSPNSAPNIPAVGQSPATNPEKWTEVTSFERYIAYEQTGQTEIGAVSRVCRCNPRLRPSHPGELPFALNDLGVLVLICGGSQVWLEFRRRVPVFSAELWDTTTVFAVGDVVYDDTTGECYKALRVGDGNAVTDKAWWQKVDFPQRLKSFVVAACYADSLRGDGQTAKAMAEDSKATDFLILACDDAFAGQQQYSVASYR